MPNNLYSCVRTYIIGAYRSNCYRAAKDRKVPQADRNPARESKLLELTSGSFARVAGHVGGFFARAQVWNVMDCRCLQSGRLAGAKQDLCALAAPIYCVICLQVTFPWCHSTTRRCPTRVRLTATRWRRVCVRWLVLYPAPSPPSATLSFSSAASAVCWSRMAKWRCASTRAFSTVWMRPGSLSTR